MMPMDPRHWEPRQAGYSMLELMAALLITFFIMGGVYGLMIRSQNTYEQQTGLADAQQAARIAIDLMTREIRMAGSDPSGRAFSPDSACIRTISPVYDVPADETKPDPQDLAGITIAQRQRIRVKMDRPTWGLPPETILPLVDPPRNVNCSLPAVAPEVDDYLDDNEDGLGDGFLNDEGEDVEYFLDGKTLKRTERRTCPATACQGCKEGDPGWECERCNEDCAELLIESPLELIGNVVKLEFLYFDAAPPLTPCPPIRPKDNPYKDVADYETARAGCDKPMDFDDTSTTPSSVTNESIIRRVRIRLSVETEKKDPLKKRTDPNEGKNIITLTTEVTLRNRVK